MSAFTKSGVHLPRLRTRDELLKTSPELFNKLLLGEDMSSARSTSPHAPQAGAGATAGRPGSGAGGKPQSALGGRATSATRAGALMAAYDTPRGFGDEPLSAEQELAIELESVKKERQQLLGSISQAKAESGTAGGEAQQADIRQLLKELELKKAKLNELKGESRRTEGAIARARDDDTDAQRLTPGECAEENTYIQSLRDEMMRVEDELLEADAKNRLYYLLGERTRAEHMAIDQKVRDKQESKRACLEDLAALTAHLNATRAAREGAEKDLAKTKRQVAEARGDWTRKIRERRTEVRDLKKRQQKEHEREVRRREKLLEKEKAERALQAKLKMEHEAYQLQVAALAPKVEAMEASWNRLRAISGAEGPSDVVEYWQGLKAKEANMRELVALAERREAACKEEIGALLASRSAMYESRRAAEGTRSACALPTAAAAADLEGEPEAAAEGGPQGAAGAAPACAADTEGVEDAEAAAARIEAAERRMDAAQVQFNKLRGICVAAEQGMRSLLRRLAVVLDEAAPAAQSPLAHDAPAAPPAGGALTNHSSLSGGAVAVSGTRLHSAGATSSVRSVAGHFAAGEGVRGSASGSSRQASRATRELDAALASKSNRLTSRAVRSAGCADGLPAPPGLALAPQGPPAGAAADRAPPVAGLQLAGLASAHGAAAAGTRPMLPSRGRNTIDDDSFFEGLPQLLGDVTMKLEKLLAAEEGIDYEAVRAAAAAAAADAGSTAASTAPCTVQPTPRVEGPVGGGSSGTAPAPAGATGVAAGGAVQQQQQQQQAAPAAAVAEASAATADGAMAEGEQAAAGADGDQSSADNAAGGDKEGDLGAGAGGGRSSAVGEDSEQQQPAEASDEEQTDGAAGAAAEAEEDCASPAGDGREGAGQAAPGTAAAAAAAAAAAGGAEPAAPAAASPAEAPAAAVPEPQRPVSSTTHGTARAASPPLHSSSGAASPVVVPAAAAAVGGTLHASIPESEMALVKGLYRRTWTGAPWLDAVGGTSLDLSLVPSMKRKKGRGREATLAPDLTRILGYTAPMDEAGGSESDSGDEDGAAEGGAGPGSDGVVGREWIKMRAAKMTARHNAKQAAAAAAAQQQGGGR